MLQTNLRNNLQFLSGAQNILMVFIFQASFQYSASEVVANLFSKNPMGISPDMCVPLLVSFPP